MIQRFLIVLMIVAAVSLAAIPLDVRAQTKPDDAAAFVGVLGSETIKVLQSQSATLDQREAEVRRLLRENFALDQIGRYVLGRAWKTATDDQKREYLELFSEYVLSTYAKRLGGYTGETFSIIRSETVGTKDAVVMTQIDRPSGPPLVAGWRVRNVGERMVILDVIVEGISMVTAQRSEFASVVQSQGIEGLLQTLRLQISKFAAQSS
ncbi:MAG: ABC transporter substrate-binding protein [Rhodospirillales bacterium]